jgi:hypothetical protein
MEIQRGARAPLSTGPRTPDLLLGIGPMLCFCASVFPKTARTFRADALDHDEFGSNRSKLINVIDSIL